MEPESSSRIASGNIAEEQHIVLAAAPHATSLV